MVEVVAVQVIVTLELNTTQVALTRVGAARVPVVMLCETAVLLELNPADAELVNAAATTRVSRVAPGRGRARPARTRLPWARGMRGGGCLGSSARLPPNATKATRKSSDDDAAGQQQ